MAGKKRLGCFCSLPVCCCGCPVECCPLVVVFLAAAWYRCVLVLDGSAFVRLCCPQEGPNTGGKCLLCRGLGDGRVMLCFDELLAGGHRVLVFPLSLSQFVNARGWRRCAHRFDGGGPPGALTGSPQVKHAC
jgi:hypothetical protein